MTEWWLNPFVICTFSKHVQISVSHHIRLHYIIGSMPNIISIGYKIIIMIYSLLKYIDEFMFMGLYVINKKWTYLYTYTHTHTRTYCHQIHIWIHTYTRTYIYTYICTNVSHTCATNIRMYVHACIHTYIHTYTYKYTHTHLDTCIQTYALWCIMHTYTKHKYIHALQTCICMLQTYIHTYIYKYTRVCIHIHT
jgi:hypothetical protein